ncbi:MAG: bacteriorhodopsin [Planctomycetota bacterium]
MENFIVFSPIANFVISHILSLGAACMFAGLLYFLVTAKQASPKYRMCNYLGAVVMVSAALELGNQYLVWKGSINAIDTPMGVLFARTGEAAFSNGYRYVNWSIDVPVLLMQIVIVLGLTGKKFWSPVAQFTIAGLLMIWTGYIGQFYEAVPAAGATTSLATADQSFLNNLTASVLPGEFGQNSIYWIMFVVSCIFYAWILLLVVKVGLSKENLDKMPPAARNLMKYTMYLLIGSWMLYVVGYLMPAISISEESAAIRQVVYTIADVTSKVIYGVMLGQVATLRSQAEGYDLEKIETGGYASAAS